jgi:hypothetical protein
MNDIQHEMIMSVVIGCWPEVSDLGRLSSAACWYRPITSEAEG